MDAFSRRHLLRGSLGLAGAAALAACGATSTPQVVEKVVTQVIEREVTKIVEGTPQVVKETVVVESTVLVEKEVEVTAAPPANADKIAVWAPGGSGTVADWNYDPILQVVEEATNTDIEMAYFDWDVYNDKVNAAAASGTVPDIIGSINHESVNLWGGWVRDGVVAAFEGEVADAAPLVMDQYVRNPHYAALKVDGKIYAQPIFWSEGLYPNMGLLHVRKDLLDSMGLQPPDTFEQYFAFLEEAKAMGLKAVLAGMDAGVGPAINSFAGAFGLPFRGWVKEGTRYGFWAAQPGVKEALLLFRKMVADGLVAPESWEPSDDGGRTAYVSGEAASLIYNGGGHNGRIQTDMLLVNEDFKEWLLPAPGAGASTRGYTSEEMFWGASFLGGMKNNKPVAAARVMNFLISPEGAKLTAVGIEGRNYVEENGEIKLLPQRTKDGFPTEMGDEGAHPLATEIVSWQPQEWQNWTLLYGRDQAFKDWYTQMWENQGKYQIEAYGLLTKSPLWIQFEATSSELIDRNFLTIVRAQSDDEAATLFDRFLSDWKAAGGEDATLEMSELIAQQSA